VGQSLVVILQEGKCAAHDGTGFEDNQNIEELQHELDGHVQLIGEAFAEVHQVDEVGVGKIYPFAIELVV
jgi:hypothetical protein